MRDAANLLENLDVDTPGFVAVDDGKWVDGFHPPKACNLSGIVNARSGVCRIQSLDSIIAQMREKRLEWVIDLSCYFPSVAAGNAQDVREIELIFRDRSQDVALTRWGGIWITIHDATKSYFSLPSGKVFERHLVSRIILSQAPDRDQLQMDELWSKIETLDPDKCLVVIIHENCLWTDFMPVELHRYEQIEKLAKVAHSAVGALPPTAFQGGKAP